jgi:hypothetical protein
VVAVDPAADDLHDRQGQCGHGGRHHMASQPFQVFAHLPLGTLLSFALFGCDAHRRDPVLALGRRSAGVLS